LGGEREERKIRGMNIYYDNNEARHKCGEILSP